jgi:hypothetical protein
MWRRSTSETAATRRKGRLTRKALRERAAEHRTRAILRKHELEGKG